MIRGLGLFFTPYNKYKSIFNYFSSYHWERIEDWWEWDKTEEGFKVPKDCQLRANYEYDPNYM